jgi:tripartite-type tricarboxylate transporter receptor subunit TctC
MTHSVMVRAALTLLLFALPFSACAQDKFPQHLIQLIVPFAPGTATDVVGRVIAERLASNVGQRVVVIDRPGGGGIIGTDAVAKATPDGYTLLLVNSTHSSNAVVHKSLPYDTVRDFSPIALVAEAPGVLVVPSTLGVRTLKEFVALIRANPNKYNYGTSGVGSGTHFGALNFLARAGIQMVAVHYKGSEIMQDILAGRIHFLVAPLQALLPGIHDGRLIPLAVASREPMRTPIELETVEKTADLPGFEHALYYSFFAPAKTPRPVIDALSTELLRIVQQKEVRDRFSTMATFPRSVGPDELGAFIRADIEKAAALLKSAGIEPE